MFKQILSYLTKCSLFFLLCTFTLFIANCQEANPDNQFSYKFPADSIHGDSTKITIIKARECTDIVKLTYHFEDLTTSIKKLTITKDTTSFFIPSGISFFHLVTENDYLLLASFNGKRYKTKNPLKININGEISNNIIEIHKVKSLLIIYRVFIKSQDFNFCHNLFLKNIVNDIKSEEMDQYIKYLIIADKNSDRSDIYPVDSISGNSLLFSRYPDEEIHSFGNNVKDIDTLLNSKFIPVDSNQFKVILLTNFVLKNDFDSEFQSLKNYNMLIFSTEEQDKLKYTADVILDMDCGKNESKQINKFLKK